MATIVQSDTKDDSISFLFVKSDSRGFLTTLNAFQYKLKAKWNAEKCSKAIKYAFLAEKSGAEDIIFFARL